MNKLGILEVGIRKFTEHIFMSIAIFLLLFYAVIQHIRANQGPRLYYSGLRMGWTFSLIFLSYSIDKIVEERSVKPSQFKLTVFQSVIYQRLQMVECKHGMGAYILNSIHGDAALLAGSLQQPNECNYLHCIM